MIPTVDTSYQDTSILLYSIVQANNDFHYSEAQSLPQLTPTIPQNHAYPQTFRPHIRSTPSTKSVPRFTTIFSMAEA